MALSETCSRCGEEVRWGVREGVLKHHHRDPLVDHEPAFGNIAFNSTIDYEAIGASRNDKNGEEDERIFEIPPPEVYATEIFVGDERLPGGAKNLIKAVAKVEGISKATYSRGARVHGSQGNLLGMSDIVVVKFRVADRTATGSWWDGKLDSAWITHYAPSNNPGHRTVRVEDTTAADMRAWLVTGERK